MSGPHTRNHWLICTQNITAPSSDEEEDFNTLQAIESKLLQHDPTFDTSHTHASLSSQSSLLLSTFKPPLNESDVAAHAQIALNTERFRVPQVWFEPGMAGVDTAGLGEVIQNALGRFNPGERRRLVRNVFLTGGPSQIPGLQETLHATLRPMLDPEMDVGIVRAVDCSSDAWKGMAMYARTEEFRRDGGGGVSRAEYEEWGGERVRRWWGGNRNGAV